MTEPTRDKFSPAQSRAGRGFLGWTIERLAEEAGLEPEAVELYEAGEGDLGDDERRELGAAFNDAGCIAKGATQHAGEGVRMTILPGELLEIHSSVRRSWSRSPRGPRRR